MSDTRADAKRRRSAKRREARDPAYLAWIRTLPCCICAAYGVDCHHEPARSVRGWHDRKTLPLCRECHTRRHTYGAARFWEVAKAHAPTLIAEMQRRFETEVNPADEF